jgi:hypothetical protein
MSLLTQNSQYRGFFANCLLPKTTRSNGANGPLNGAAQSSHRVDLAVC